jgi:HD-like signal output (HDOD) protein
MGVIAFFLASKVRRIEASKALLGGLFQDIGVPAILVAMNKYPAVFDTEHKKANCLDELAPKIGALILKQWGFDEALIETVKSRKDWLMNNEEAGLPELILVARLHALIGSTEFKECPPFDEIPAFSKLDLGELGPDGTLQVLSDSQQEINDIQHSLGA